MLTAEDDLHLIETGVLIGRHDPVHARTATAARGDA
jgi:hypothetical protein